ncbi:MAG: F0F1 ATP synthase subunit delta [Ignavibacteriales bacterium]
MPLVEKRYAEALIRIGVDKNLIDTFKADMESIEKTIAENIELKKFLNNPSLKSSSKKEVIEKIFGKEAHKDTVNFIKILVDKGRMKNFSEIIEQYSLLADEIKKCLNLKVISSEALSDSQIKKLGEKLRVVYGSQSVKVDNIIDSSILGGVVVKIGDKMIDGSVKGKLDRMQSAIG